MYQYWIYHVTVDLTCFIDAKSIRTVEIMTLVKLLIPQFESYCSEVRSADPSISFYSWIPRIGGPEEIVGFFIHCTKSEFY